MGLFYNRPFALACICLAATAFLCYFLNATACLWVALGLFLTAAVATVVSFLRKRRAVFLIGLCLLFSSMAALSSSCLLHARSEWHESLIGTEVEIKGTVLSVEETRWGGEELEVALYRLNGDPCYDTVRLRSSFSTEISVGDAMRARVTCERFFSDADYDARATALSDGIFGVMRLSDAESIERAADAPVSLRAMMLSWRAELAARLSDAIGGEEGALCVAFLLGDKSLLSADSILHFRRVGVSHLLALSGLHVSILIAFLEFVLKKLTCPRTIRAVTVILLSLAYLLLTGCSLSTVRAVLMCCTLMLAFLFRGSYDSFTSLCAALALILLLSPWAIGDLGMWMSFLAAGSIIIFTPLMLRVREFLRENFHGGGVLSKAALWLASSFLVGVVANLAMAPIQGFLFGELPLLSIPATILLSYPLTAVLILSMLCLILPPIGVLCRAVAAAILSCTELFSGLEGILLPINDAVSFGILILLSLLLILVVTLKLRSPIRWMCVAFALWLLLIPASCLVTAVGFDRLEISYVSEESGTGEMLLVARAGQCIAINLSSEIDYHPYAISKGAHALRCTEVDDLVLTSYSEADVEMLSGVAGRVLVRCLRLPIPQAEWEVAIATEICAEAESHGISVRFDRDGLLLPALSEATILEKRPNGRSSQLLLFSFKHAGTRVTYANTAFEEMHGGTLSHLDLLEDTEVMIYGGKARKYGRLSADFPRLHTLILKSPLHGNAFSEELLSRDVLSKAPSYKFE